MRLGRLAVALALVLTTALPARAAVNDPGLPQQWALPMVNAPDAWATGTGANTTIAVVDSGAHFGHEDLGNKLLPGRNFVTDGASAQDDNGHGSHVAGIAAAATNNGRGIASVAPDAKILPVKVLNHEGLGATEDVVAGIEYAADQGAAVINISLGDQPNIGAVLGPRFGQAIEYAWSKGSICVVAAGNVGDPQYDFITSPDFANHNALVVTSLDKTGAKPEKARAVRTAKWGLAAPGGNPDVDGDRVLSAWHTGANAYALAAGTSMAAPHVAGAAAILRGLGLSKEATVDKLIRTARDLGPAGRDNTYGYGALDVRAAVAGLRPAGGGTTATTAGGGTATTRKPGSGPTATTTGPGGGTISTIGDVVTTVTATDADGDGGGNDGGAPSDGDDDEDGPGGESAAGPDDGADDGRPWPAVAIAVLTLLGAVALLAGAVRPKPT